MISIIALYALFSSSFIISKELLTYTSPLFLAGIRMFIGGIFLLILYTIYYRKKIHINKKDFFLYAQVAFFGVFLTLSLRMWGLDYMSSSKAALLYNFSPFITALYSYFFFTERLSPKQISGLIVGFVGLIPILLTSSANEISTGEWLYISWPELAILCSAAAHSYSWIIIRKLVKFKGHTPVLVNGLTMVAGGLLSLMASFVVEGSLFPVTEPLSFFRWLFLIILTNNIICYNFYSYLLKRYTATLISFAGFLSPLFATFYGWFFRGEIITWHFYASLFGVFLGLFLFYQDELWPKAHNQPLSS